MATISQTVNIEMLEKLPDGTFKRKYPKTTYANIVDPPEIPTSFDRIGDIKTTVRTDLGDDWLLCNKQYFSPEEYPELAELLPVTPAYWSEVYSFPPGGTIMDVAYGNGYWVAVGDNGTLYYKQGEDLVSGTWVKHSMGTSTNFHTVGYGNGYWVVAGQSGTIYYKQGDPNGAWSTQVVGGYAYNDVHYAGGYWVLVGRSSLTSYKATMAYRATSPDGSWTYAELTQSTSTQFYSVHNNGTYWVLVGNISKIFYKTGAPSGTWQDRTKPDSAAIYSVHYGDGYWVFGLSNGNIYYSDTPSGTLSVNEIGLPSKTGVAYGDGSWVIMGDSRTPYYIKGAPSNTYQTSAQLTDSSVIFNRLRFIQGKFVASVSYGGSKLLSCLNVTPLITGEAYYYIKGR